MTKNKWHDQKGPDREDLPDSANIRSAANIDLASLPNKEETIKSD